MADENDEYTNTPIEDFTAEVAAPQGEDSVEAENNAAVEAVDAHQAETDAVEEPAVEEPAAVAETPAVEVPAAADEQPAVEEAVSAEEQPAAEAPTAEAQPAIEAAAEPEIDLFNPVALGLLPEVFVSRASTQLHFYAPDFDALPPLRPVRQQQQQSRGRGREERQRVVEVVNEPQRISGSTRLEAKKQRRRDGREAGRRRPVVTEAEFLARREAVDRQMIVRSREGRTQIAVLEDNILVEHYVARNQEASLIGNVYLGRVQNVLPSMEAAFVDIGRGRNAVLYSGEVDWDGVETGGQPRRIELALKAGDKVLVQVTKDPVGHKGARLTSQISLPGRYLVYVPGGSMNGISRKLPDTERARLKRILKETLPESSGVIVRTAAEGATEEQLTHDVQRLTAQWEHIQNAVTSAGAPTLLHAEPDLLVKIVRDVFNEDFTGMIIQGADVEQTIRSYLTSVAPDLLERIAPYGGDDDPFDKYRINEQIEKALDRKVYLPSGGSLVIDRTEAMTVVDVNTGKFVGSGGNLEETVTKNNLEAAEEVVRQLRLRDIGGIIVVDFIDMVLESNRDLVLRRLVECLSRDRTKHQVAEVTSLGLVQMTRKKLGLGLLETFSEPCEACAARGIIVHHEPVTKKHSSNSGGQSSRRSRGNNGTGSAPQNATHAIPSGAKTALAQIAASTIAADEHAADSEPVEETPRKPRRSRGGKSKEKASQVEEQQGEPDAVASDSAPVLPELAPIADAAPRETPSREEAAKLLSSVLAALPEAGTAGTGSASRNRGRGTRRRVTTAPATPASDAVENNTDLS